MEVLAIIVIVVIVAVVIWRASTKQRDDWTVKNTNEYMKAEKMYMETGRASKDAESKLEADPENEEVRAEFLKADVLFQQVAKHYCIVAAKYCELMIEVWGHEPGFLEFFKPAIQKRNIVLSGITQWEKDGELYSTDDQLMQDLSRIRSELEQKGEWSFEQQDDK